MLKKDNQEIKTITNEEIYENIRSIWNTQFQFITDDLVYEALLFLAIQNKTTTPQTTISHIRRITGIYDHRTVTNSLDRLVENSYLEKKLIPQVIIENQENGHHLYTYRIISLLEQSVLMDFEIADCLDNIIFDHIPHELHFKNHIGRSYKLLTSLLKEDLDMVNACRLIGMSKDRTSKFGKTLVDLGLMVRVRNGRNSTYSLVENFDSICNDIVSPIYEQTVQTLGKEENYFYYVDVKKKDSIFQNGLFVMLIVSYLFVTGFIKHWYKRFKRAYKKAIRYYNKNTDYEQAL